MAAGLKQPVDLALLLEETKETHAKASKELDRTEKVLARLREKGGTRREEIRAEEAFERAEETFRAVEQSFQGLKERVTRLRAILDPGKKEDASYVEYLSTDPQKAESVTDPVKRIRHATIFDTLIDGRRICLVSEPAVLVFFSTKNKGVTYVEEGRSGKAKKLFSVHVAEEDILEVKRWIAKRDAYKKERQNEHILDELFAPTF